LTFVALSFGSRIVQTSGKTPGTVPGVIRLASVSGANENSPVGTSPVFGSVVAVRIAVAGGTATVGTAIGVTSSSAGSGSSGIAVSPAAVAIVRVTVPTVVRS
jgi:hypothetical protein